MEHSIIHLNIADFGVSIERLENSTLKHQALILIPPTTRGVVYDMSEEAYQEGVRKGMSLSIAKRFCPRATLLPPRPELYRQAMDKIIKTSLYYTPLVEKSAGDGHLFLDVTGTHRLFGPPPDIGWRIRKTIRRDLGVDPIWSVAPNKLVAKVASRLVKPVGEYIVAAGEEEPFLSPLPLAILPGLDRFDLVRLQDFNLYRISQVTSLTMQQLSTICGSSKARFLHQAVRGMDFSPVTPQITHRNTVNITHHFDDDTNDKETVESVLFDIIEQAGHTLRKQGMGCCMISVRIDYSDTRRSVRQVSSKTPVTDNPTLYKLAQNALRQAWHRRIRLRRLSLSCGRLTKPIRQLSLFTAENKKQLKNDKISSALDQIRERFGGDSIKTANR